MEGSFGMLQVLTCVVKAYYHLYECVCFGTSIDWEMPLSQIQVGSY